MEEKETFTYTYSAPEQDEVRRIQEKYLPKEKNETESKLDQLRALDQKVDRPATALAIIVGVVGTLIFGTGMALALSYNKMLAGILVSVIGFAVLACALPVHSAVLKKQKEKYGPQILKLAEELQQ